MINFSVIIPCFNSESTIECCINSILTQTFLPKEIIVIDDGSTDSTLDILQRLRDTAENRISFKILTQKNSGPSTARNNGVAHANTDWILFLDSDDYWKKYNLENLYKFLQTNDQFNLIGGSNTQLECKSITFSQLLFKNYFQTSSTIVKKSWIVKFPFNEGQKHSEDYRSWLLIVSETPACIISNYIAKPVISDQYSFRGNGLSSNLWKMTKGELSNYMYLFKLNKISLIKLTTISTYSFVRFIRRCILK